MTAWWIIGSALLIAFLPLLVALLLGCLEERRENGE